MLDLQKIQNAFADNRTEEQKAFDAKVEAEWAAYDAEIAPVMAMKSPDKWAIAEGIAQKYRRRGIVFPHIATNE
jgi:hypothetical protein